MSQDVMSLGSSGGQDSWSKGRSQAFFALVSDIDTDGGVSDDDLRYSSLRSRRSRGNGDTDTQKDSGGRSALDDEEFLEIFGLPKTSIRSTGSDTQQTTTRKNSTASFHGLSAGSSQTGKDEVIEILDDPSEVSRQDVPRELNILGSELICIDDDDYDEEDVGKADNAYPSSSPNTQANRSIDLIDIDDNEEEYDARACGVLHSHSNTSTTIDDSLSLIMNAGSVPLPYPQDTPRRSRMSAARERANIGPYSSPIQNRSSSIGRISVPTRKPSDTPRQRSKTTETTKVTKSSSQKASKVMQNMRTAFLNIQNKHDPPPGTKSQSSRRSTNVFNAEKANRTLSSEISDFSSSMNEIDFNNERLLTDEEINEKRRNLKYLKKRESNRVKSLISDLAGVRNKRTEKSSKYSKSVNGVINSFKAAASTQVGETSEISNSSAVMKEVTNNFMDNVTDDINLYTDERLDLMLERAKQLEPDKLKKVNQFKYTKPELTEKITCCFTNVLDEKLQAIEKEYPLLVQPAKSEVIEDSLPIIRFKRYVDSVLHKKKNTFVPVKPRQLYENFTIILYEGKDLIPLFKKGIMKRHINSIKSKYPGTKIAVWVTGYDQYLQSLKTKANKVYKEKVQQRLDPAAVETSKKKKSNQNLEDLIQPSHIKQKMLKYEVEYDFTFQSFKGCKDMLEWLKSIAYTLSSKYNDSSLRNGEISNIGKVKSGESPRDCAVMMLSQIKGMTEGRARKFVDEGSYTSIGDLYDEIVAGKCLSRSKVLRTDHERLMKKVFLAKNENDLL